MGGVQFGALVRELRNARGWSLRDLGERIHFSRGYVGKVELGDRFPDRPFARLADGALEARGALIEAHQVEDERRREAERVGTILSASVTDSLKLLTAEERGDIDALQAAASRLAVDYLALPPGEMLVRAVALRSQFVGRLKARDYRDREVGDLYRGFGMVQGVLAYAALDLGTAAGATTHAELGWRLAERTDDNEMRVWVRGTQSLIARFETDYARSQLLIEDGLRYDAPGTGRIRLLAGLAQSRANLGDSGGANRALDAAQRQRRLRRSPDSARGLFEFSTAKQHYYAGSSLMWLPDEADAVRSAKEAGLAVAMWEQEPPETRSLDDEALARIYQATARVHLHDLAGAAESVAPILELAADRRISWITRRLRNLADALNATTYARSVEARELHDKVLAWEHSRPVVRSERRASGGSDHRRSWTAAPSD